MKGYQLFLLTPLPPNTSSCPAPPFPAPIFPIILVIPNPFLPYIPPHISPDFPNLSSLTWLSCPGFWLIHCPSHWLLLLCLFPWHPSMQTSITTLLTPIRCDSDWGPQLHSGDNPLM